MNWIIAVPSYRRAALLKKKTLLTLSKGGVPADRIYVFVASEMERTDYETTLTPSTYNSLIVGVPGLAAQRNFIRIHFPIDSYIVFMDDDIAGFVGRSDDGKKVHITDVPALIARGFKEMGTANIWGIYPVNNPFFMKNTVTRDLRYIIGAFYGIRNTHNPAYDLQYGDNQEDKERTLRYWTADGVVVRLNDVAPNTVYYSTGGMESPTRKADTERYTEELLKEFPQYLTRVYKEKAGIYDLRFRRKAGGLKTN